MLRALAASAGLVAAFVAPALGCSFMPGERPWSERVGDEPVIFVGKVIAIFSPDEMVAMERGRCGPDAMAPTAMGDPDGTCVVLKVEQKIRGATTRTYEVPQGHSADCAIGYEVGQYWLYAGNFIGGPSQQLTGRLSRSDLLAMRKSYGD